MMHMTDPTIAQAFTLETLARETQHAIPCAHCNRRPAVVLDYLCAECDALEASPATVPYVAPAPSTGCRGCEAPETLADGLCADCYGWLAAVVDETRWVEG